jgi:predicted Holliday junction resolvase-like endonuclease
VDFICIKFPKDGEEGYVDFIDIKTGDASRLNKDQSNLKELIDKHKIRFIKMKVSGADPI